MSNLPLEEKYHVKQVERCCGTCKYFERIYEDSFCEHPELRHDVYVHEGCICDLWEKGGGAQ
jgi:hypothetical protein